MPDRPRLLSAVFTASVVFASMASVPMGTVSAEPRPRTPLFVDETNFVPLCTPDDSVLDDTPDGASLDELSGLASVDGLLYAVGDSGSDSAVAVMDERCSVLRWLPLPTEPYDVEDLAARADGTLVLADTGDNGRRRTTVALISMDRQSGAGQLHRLTYPDGAHDAETILIQRDGTPFIVTKEVFGAGGVYRPVGGTGLDALAGPGPTALEKVGVLDVSNLDAGESAPVVKSTMFTGGAVSADGTVLAVRTHSDVFLYAAPDGDVGTALAAEPAVRVRLPRQPQGEAIAFTEGGDLLIGSEARDGPIPPIQILRGAVALVENHSASAAAHRTDGTANTRSAEKSDLTKWPAAVAVVVGVIIVFYAVWRRVRSGRR